ETPDARLEARPLAPLAFSGDLPVTSRMIDGPIRDFNVIYDGRRLTAVVTVLCENAVTELAQGEGRHYACLALTPGLSLDGAALPQGAVAMASTGHLQAGPGACGLVAAFAPR
ncbi:MAG: HutD family protein, partial [Albidovulum sp.]